MASATACLRQVLRVFISSPLVLALLLLSCFVCCYSASSSSQPKVSILTPSVNSTDQAALLAFKSALAGDPLGALASWNRTLHWCRWTGVMCGGRRHPERVIGLNLSSLGLSGAMPTSIANLTFLRSLDLSSNSLSGHIPLELGRLSRLRNLTLDFNSLTGEIPAGLGRCTNLRKISVEANMLEGAIPPSLSNLSSLQHLYLMNNRISGHIPPWLGNLTSLTDLSLKGNSLVGSIPPDIGNLLSLRQLDLSNNNLEGDIPPTFGNLQRLIFLEMSNNSVSGTIPLPLTNLSMLEFLYLSSNNLTGSIPPSLGGLPTLVELDVQRNSLTGIIPPSLGNLTSVASLSLTSNALFGTIPPTIGHLTGLSIFTAAINELSGSIPSSVYNLSSLEQLDLGVNQLSGTLPPCLFTNLPSLRFFSVSQNQFHGPIPTSIPNASTLDTLGLNVNNFDGVLPSSFGTLKGLRLLLLQNNYLEMKDNDGGSFFASLANCTDLKHLTLETNRLGGVLPHAISNLSTHLTMMTLSGNHISGSIPEGIGDLAGLTVFRAGGNLLRGAIPPTFGKLQNLGELNLQSNDFSGQIPPSIANLTALTELYLGGNNLGGSIPPSFGSLKNLQRLSLSYNKLTGAVPKELVSISSLSILLDLSHNALSGALPGEVGHLINLYFLDVSENKLSGEIPFSLGDCKLLGMLHIQGNTFHGVIPQSFSKLSGIESLDLSRNNLSGRIPEFLQRLHSLSYLNLSFNDLDGEIPTGGIFQNASALSVLGNPKLCGGIPELHLRACSPRESRRHKSILTIIIITVSALLFCLVTLILHRIFSRYLRKKSSPPMASPYEPLPRISYSELLKATEGFSSQNLIGVGSFGSVYKANMDTTDPNGKFLAVKVINLQQHGASKSFMTECEVLRGIRHRNLLKILTSCSSIDYSGNHFKALVFEFMPNGSLEKWLHSVEKGSGEKHLSLVQRLNIAIDVASALAYLHHHSYKSIVHCDLKPSNVLLNNDMIAHVSDFGIAKFLINDGAKNPSSSLALRGSIGYIAPEYGMGCTPSIEGDAFSYGVLILEMITGRRPTDASLENDLTLHKLVEMLFPGQLLTIVDPDLLIEDDGVTYERKETCLVSMARLGLICSKESPKERMGMEEVSKEMAKIRDTFLCI